jgi:hypothetical protein
MIIVGIWEAGIIDAITAIIIGRKKTSQTSTPPPIPSPTLLVIPVRWNLVTFAVTTPKIDPTTSPVIRWSIQPAAVDAEPKPISMAAATKNGCPLTGIIYASPPITAAPTIPPREASCTLFETEYSSMPFIVAMMWLIE